MVRPCSCPASYGSRDGRPKGKERFISRDVAEVPRPAIALAARTRVRACGNSQQRRILIVGYASDPRGRIQLANQVDKLWSVPREAKMARMFVDCREYPSDMNCTVAISADTKKELVNAAV